jgi:hypothetical protein
MTTKMKEPLLCRLSSKRLVKPTDTVVRFGGIVSVRNAIKKGTYAARPLARTFQMCFISEAHGWRFPKSGSPICAAPRERAG